MLTSSSIAPQPPRRGHWTTPTSPCVTRSNICVFSLPPPQFKSASQLTFHKSPRRAISTSFPLPPPSFAPLFSPRVSTQERTPPQRRTGKLAGIWQKESTPPPPQMPGGHSPLLPNPSCSSSSGILKSPLARSIDQPQAGGESDQDPEMPLPRADLPTARIQLRASSSSPLGGVCALRLGREGRLGTGAGRPALSSSPPPPPIPLERSTLAGGRGGELIDSRSNPKTADSIRL